MSVRSSLKRAVRAPGRAARRKARGVVRAPKRAAGRKIRQHPLFHCGTCGKQYNSPFGHTCKGSSDFKRRKRAAERSTAAAAAKQRRAQERERVNARVAAAREAERDRARGKVTAARRAERAKADARVARAKAAKAAKRPPVRPSHDYRNCRDHDCERAACEAWREAYAEGVADAQTGGGQ